MKPLLPTPLLQLLLIFVTSFMLTGCSDDRSSSTSTSTSLNETPEPQPTIIEPPPLNEERTGLSITLSWTPPLAREDGEILKMADIGGYEIVSERNNVQIASVTVSAANVTTHTFNDLSPANYAFSIYTYDNQNHISQPSKTLSISLAQFPKL